jgi:hypothetical protein
MFLGGNVNLSFRFQNFLGKQDPDLLVMITNPKHDCPPKNYNFLHEVHAMYTDTGF